MFSDHRSLIISIDFDVMRSEAGGGTKLTQQQSFFVKIIIPKNQCVCRHKTMVEQVKNKTKNEERMKPEKKTNRKTTTTKTQKKKKKIHMKTAHQEQKQ